MEWVSYVNRMKQYREQEENQMAYSAEEVRTAFAAKAKPGGNRWQSASGWESMGWGSEGTVEALLLQGRPTVVKWVAGSDLDEDPGYSSQPVWVVVEIDGQYFKKEGYHSSEEGVVWDGRVTEVARKTKTVTYYE